MTASDVTRVGPNVVHLLIDAPVAEEHKIEPFTRQEMRRILNAAKGHCNAAPRSVAPRPRQPPARGARPPPVRGNRANTAACPRHRI